jgi:hypothetical protein
VPGFPSELQDGFDGRSSPLASQVILQPAGGILHHRPITLACSGAFNRLAQRLL